MRARSPALLPVLIVIGDCCGMQAMNRQFATGEPETRCADAPVTQGEMVPRRSATDAAASIHPATQLHTLALEALAQIQAALQSNTALAQQSAALEEQLQQLLAERIALFERIELLEAQLAERAPRATERQLHPLPPLASLPAVLHRERLEAVAFGRRFSRAVVSDDETLLGTPADPGVPAPIGDDLSVGPLVARGYTLTAWPFARFTDLGGFQEAVQSLPGIRNVRVRRFAQATLEMRLDYDGERPLTDLLRGLTLPIEEVVQEDPAHLSLRLTPFEDRIFPALS